ncbi:MAG: sensor histidine kinase [Acidobacteriota bacterium]
MNRDKERIDFIVGAELRLQDIFSAVDVTPLLTALVTAGARQAALTDETGRVLWLEGEECGIDALPAPVLQDLNRGRNHGRGWRSASLYHEGESLGFIYIASSDTTHPGLAEALISIASATLEIIRLNTVKRLLTTQVHTTAVHQSYEELLEINRQLTISKKQYEDLARTLQQRVKDRTAELEAVHTRLLQKEKMACIGQLAGGVAHEINTPLNYISANIRTLSSYLDDVHGMLEGYRKALQQLPGEQTALQRLEELYRRVDVPYIIKDKEDLVRESLEGTEQIGSIVANLKGFSHIDELGNRMMDVNEELETTLQVLAHTQKNRSAKIIKKYGRIPECYGEPALMSQVFLNVLTNALQSRDEGLAVTVETVSTSHEIVVSVTDNGGGIPEEIRSRIFEPFFTTRDVGEGTGVGLAVAYDIVTRHGGRIAVQSDVGRGTKFDIILPAGTPAGAGSDENERAAPPHVQTPKK